MKHKIIRFVPIAIIIAALGVSAPRLASALAFAEPPFMGLPIEILTGPAFGVTAVGTTVYIWHVYQRRKRLKLAPLLLAGWIGLLSLIALVIVPGMVIEVRSGPLADLLEPPSDVIWCAALSISSELVVGLAALAAAIDNPTPRRKSGGASVAQKPAKIGKSLTARARRDKLLDTWRQDGDETFTQLADKFGVSRQTISNDFIVLRKDGKVRRKDGSVEVIDKENNGHSLPHPL